MLKSHLGSISVLMWLISVAQCFNWLESKTLERHTSEIDGLKKQLKAMRTEIKGLHTQIDAVKKHAKKEAEKLKGKASKEKVQSLVYEVIALGSKDKKYPKSLKKVLKEAFTTIKNNSTHNFTEGVDYLTEDWVFIGSTK